MGQDHPDSKLHPHATGLAAGLVLKHQKPAPLKLYAGWFCPFVQRVWMVLEVKKLDYQYKEINPYHKSKELMDLNPRGLVPTLEYDHKPLYESTVMCEFLEDAYPSALPRLLPSEPYEKARARIWIDFVTSRIIPSYHRFLQYQPKAGPSDTSDQGLHNVREDFLGKLKEFTQAMAQEGPYFMGKTLTLVDICLCPWAVRLWVFDHFKGGLNIPEGGLDEAVWSRWRTWLQAIECLDCVRETTSEMQHYLPIYQRYADDTAQSEMAKATREGKGVP